MSGDTASTDELVKIGVLGCGQISQAAHFEAVRKAKNASLAAICDLAPDLLERAALVHRPGKIYEAYDEMLAEPTIDAIIVAIADQFHVDVAIAGLDAGKHVLIEKPMGVTVEECRRLYDRAELAELVVQVGTMKRFDPGITFAHEFIRDEIGKILALKAWYCDSTYRYTMTDNLQPIIDSSASSRRPAGDPKADRRRYYLLGHGSHLVDTARFLGGPIRRVRATLVEKFDAYCWFTEVEFRDGSVGHLDLTIAVRMDWHEGFQVYGEHGSVLGKTWNPWFRKSSDVECFSTRTGQYHRPLGQDGDAYRRQVEGFAESILTGEPNVGAGAKDGLAAVQAITAISRSAESGDWVALDDVTGGP